jgi:hypothetical protein
MAAERVFLVFDEDKSVDRLKPFADYEDSVAMRAIREAIP